MAWSDRLAAFQNEVGSIQAELLDITAQLQHSCIGVGELQLSQALYTLRQELEKAKTQIGQMH